MPVMRSALNAHVRIDVTVPIREVSDIDDLKQLSMTDLLDRIYQAGQDMMRSVEIADEADAPVTELLGHICQTGQDMSRTEGRADEVKVPKLGNMGKPKGKPREVEEQQIVCEPE